MTGVKLDLRNKAIHKVVIVKVNNKEIIIIIVIMVVLGLIDGLVSRIRIRWISCRAISNQQATTIPSHLSQCHINSNFNSQTTIMPSIYIVLQLIKNHLPMYQPLIQYKSKNHKQ